MHSKIRVPHLLALSLASILIAASPGHGSTLNDLYRITGKLLQANGEQLAVSISPDPRYALGNAAIYPGGFGQAYIFVDPRSLAGQDENTWAFILGHELSHVLNSLPGNIARNEQEADYHGAKRAIAAGYDLKSYLDGIRRRPNACAPTHGCWHDRAAILASRMEVEYEVPSRHAEHGPGMPSRTSFPGHEVYPKIGCELDGDRCHEHLSCSGYSACPMPRELRRQIEFDPDGISSEPEETQLDIDESPFCLLEMGRNILRNTNREDQIKAHIVLTTWNPVAGSASGITANLSIDNQPVATLSNLQQMDCIELKLSKGFHTFQLTQVTVYQIQPFGRPPIPIRQGGFTGNRFRVTGDGEYGLAVRTDFVGMQSEIRAK